MSLVAASLTLTRPDDWHLHLRDGAALRNVVGATAAVFGRAIVMPNLKPPVTTVQAASEYRTRIVDALPQGSRFEPLMKPGGLLFAGHSENFTYVTQAFRQRGQTVYERKRDAVVTPRGALHGHGALTG